MQVLLLDAIVRLAYTLKINAIVFTTTVRVTVRRLWLALTILIKCVAGRKLVRRLLKLCASNCEIFGLSRSVSFYQSVPGLIQRQGCYEGWTSVL